MAVCVSDPQPAFEDEVAKRSPKIVVPRLPVPFSRQIQVRVCMAGLLVCGMATASGQELSESSRQGNPGPVLTIRVCDWAGLRAEIFEEFKQHAVRALATAKIESVWIYCRVGERSSMPERCRKPLENAELALWIRQEPPKCTGGTVGFSMIGPDGAGTYAQVYYSTVHRLAKRNGTSTARLLAMAAVHEIGHLLTGPGHHVYGVMRPSWDDSDVQMLAEPSRAILWHPAFKKKLQAGLASRIHRSLALSKRR